MYRLSALLAEIEATAADLPTDELLDHIHAGVDVLGENIDAVHNADGPDQEIDTGNEALITALMTAVYVRELITRPALMARFAAVRVSFN
jgi:hypothetical protein